MQTHSRDLHFDLRHQCNILEPTHAFQEIGAAAITLVKIQQPNANTLQ